MQPSVNSCLNRGEPTAEIRGRFRPRWATGKEREMIGRQWVRAAWLVLALFGVVQAAQAAADEAPDALIRRVAVEVVDAAKASGPEAGDPRKLMALVDAKIMPHVDFARMTSTVVGRAWRQASPEQQERLQEEFKRLLVRTYAGALSQVKDQTVTVKPLRAGSDDSEAVVRTLVKGGGEPIPVDYRLAKGADGWKIHDLNVMGVWVVDTYRGQFSAEINAHGLDGLIAALSERNRLVARAH
jgi:phospholipid transport system substrate-binding protein